MSKLFDQINKNATRQDDLVALVLKNTRELFEGFSSTSLHLVTESAVKFLDATIKNLQQKSLTKPEEVIDLITGLRVIGSAAQRETFHIKLPTVKVLVNGAGESQTVNSTLTKLAQNPHQKQTRDNIQKLINGALNGEREDMQRAIQMLTKMKAAYERAQHKIGDDADQPKPSPAPNKANV